MSYTWTCLLAALLAVAVDLGVARTNLLRRKAFWTAYAIVLLFQLIVNGLLTGLHIVTYDPSRILGPRIVFAPVEDIVFGFAMVTFTLTLWVWAGRVAVRPGRVSRSVSVSRRRAHPGERPAPPAGR